MPIISNNAVVGNKYKTHFDYLRNFCFIISHIYIICNFWSFAVTCARLRRILIGGGYNPTVSASRLAHGVDTSKTRRVRTA